MRKKGVIMYPNLYSRKNSKKAQVTIFVIIAIVLVAGVGIYFLTRENININSVSSNFQPVEDYYLSCIEDHLNSGVSLLEERGGYIYLPDFVPGSPYMPTSNYLSFMGTPIPYWFYYSGNNIAKEQTPSIKTMEEQLKKYLEENLACDFSSFSSRGFIIETSPPEVDITIAKTTVKANVKSKISAIFGDESVIINSHSKEINSKLGKFHNLALTIYNNQMQNTFLENYGLDTLNNFAPVNGVELSCSPKIWKTSDINNDLKNALEENTLALKLKGDYYTLKKPEYNYFVINIPSDEKVNFMYSKDWPTKIQIDPNQNNVLIANPVGNQNGLGIMGFCYVPYHFVYDLTYPVLIQIYDDKEIFQFPMNVVIKGNQPRNPLAGAGSSTPVNELCQYANTPINVYTYDSSLNPVEADISFNCFNENCEIGKTKISGKEAFLSENFPQCVNGFVIAKSENYTLKKYQLSTNQPGTVNLILDKLYDLDINLLIDGKRTNELAVLSFVSSENSATIVWPEQKSVKLSEGLYNISAYIYRNSTISIPETKSQKCFQTAKPGLLGLLGGTKEQCVDLTVPSQDITNGLAGGGNSQVYFTESELSQGNLEINSESLALPKTLDELQNNFILLESKELNFEFK